MFIQFLRENRYVSIILTLIRIYLGYTWFMAGWSKISSGGFEATGFLMGALEKASGDNPSVQPWWASFLEHVAIPNVEIFNVLVIWGELFVGIGLLVGFFTKTAVFFGMMMNFSYMFSGAIGTNPQLLLLSILIIIAGTNAGRYGADHMLQGKFPFNSFRKQKEAIS